MTVNIRPATTQDIDSLVVLERTFLNDELASSAMGLEGQAFGRNELTELVTRHWVVVAEDKGRIIGYVIAGRWAFFTTWPMYRTLLNRLAKAEWDGPRLTQQNSCQYGPIWIDQHYRGQGVFAALVKGVFQQIAPHFAYAVTFIAEDNERSFAAHTQKAAMQVADFFTVSARDYYLMVARTQA